MNVLPRQGIANFQRFADFSPISLLASTSQAGDGEDVTSEAIDTTGASLLVVAIADNTQEGGLGTLTDSESNTWTALPTYNEGTVSVPRIKLYYAANPNTDPSHTFDYVGGTLFYPSIGVMAFSNVKLTSPYDDESGGVIPLLPGADGISPGSITASEGNEVFVVALCQTPDTDFDIDDDFILSEEIAYSVSNNYGFAMSYKVKASSGAENPTYSWSTIDGAAACSGACFKHN